MIENNNQSSQKNWQQKQNNVEFSQVKRTAKKSNAGLNLLLMFLIAVILVSSGSGFYAWARYISRQEGNATAQVAKWSFKVTNGTQEISDTVNFAITRTDGNSHVAEGKLAPGTSGQIPIVVDTTGTETDLTYDITITINNCPQNMTFTPQTPASTTQTVTGEGTTLSPRIRTIRVQKYIPYGQVGQHNETITWNWPYETTTGNGVSYNDGIDSQDAGKEVTMQIRVVGTEVLEQPQVRLNEMTLRSNSVSLETGGTAQIEFENTNSVYGTETLTYTSSDTNVATVSNTGLITAQGAGTATITIAGRDSTKTVTVNVTLAIGTTINYTTSMNNVTLDNWKLFYNDTENDQVYLIYDDVIPNSVYKDSNGNSILKDTANNTINLSFSGDYNVYIPYDSSDLTLRGKLITAMENTANWSALTTGTMNAGTENAKDVTGTFAMGSPTLELFKKSWNEKYDDIYIATTQNNMSDGLKGYYISKTNNPPNTNEYYVSLSNSDKLYFSKSSKHYWLASPSADDTGRVVRVTYDGGVSSNYTSDTDIGFRPVVCLPSSVLE